MAFLSIALIGCGGVTGSGSAPVPSGTSLSTSTSSAGSQTQGTPKTIADIQLMSNWSSCSGNCSGENGTNGVYSMQQGVNQPSITGSSIKFNFEGGTPWGTALWWKQVGGDDSKTHFTYELQYYLDNPGASQALEFAVNQNAAGWRYEYAVQCDIKGSHVWRVWSRPLARWIPSNAACPVPAANQWNSLSWEFERTADHKVVFVAVTLNGQRSEINMTEDAFTASGSGIDVAYQMDAAGGPTPYSSWVDQIKLTEW